jgi:cell division septation protein DedD
MANYKVAQDVEAEDKLLGPFGFRQFIYLIIVAMSGIVGYGLWQLFPPLAILPLPLIVFFGALALPLRKDQPMETYLAAIVSFYLKPRKRLWKPDGVVSIVEITAPKTVEESLVKAVGGTEADRRLGYLADIADSRGWAIRHSAAPPAGTSMIGDVYNDAQSTEDMLDDTGGIAQTFENLIDKADSARMAHAHEQLEHPEFAQPQQLVYPSAAANNSAGTTTAGGLQYNPYPSSMHQSIVQPLSAQPQPAPAPVQASQPVAPPAEPQTAQTTKQPAPKRPSPSQTSTSKLTVSPDIINLASNSKNLSVETIAHEAKRLREKESSDEEVVITLR